MKFFLIRFINDTEEINNFTTIHYNLPAVN